MYKLPLQHILPNVLFMDKKEMTKRHLITCSVIVLLVIISAFNICGTKAIPTTNIINVKAAVTVTKMDSTAPRITTFVYKKTDVSNDYSFANEAMPTRDAGITRKLMFSIKKHSFKCVQSNILHSKADKMFPIIEPILKAYGIPDDFKYIPLVESGLCEGISPKGARGLWQFMPGSPVKKTQIVNRLKVRTSKKVYGFMHLFTGTILYIIRHLHPVSISPLLQPAF